MAAQEPHDYKWLLLVDPEIPSESRRRLEAYSGVLSSIVVVDLATDSPSSFSAVVTEHAGVGAVRLITTRLDSDDAVAADFLRRIDDAAAQVPPGQMAVLVFTSGLELSAGRVYWRPFPRSPFASLVETLSDCPLTIMATGHEQVAALAPVVELGSPPAWIQVIHDDNVLNRVRGVRVPRARLLRGFAIEDTALGQHEPFLALVVGIPASWLRLGLDVVRNPRYLRKIACLFHRRR